jgi:ankyrin repeat protein
MEKLESECLKEYITYNDDMLEYVMLRAINDNEKDKMMKLRIALKVGLDPTKLIRACISNNEIGMLVFILKQNIDIVKCADELFLLHLCVVKNNTSILKYLLNQNVNVNAINDKGHTPLSLAIIFSSTTDTTTTKTINSSDMKLPAVDHKIPTIDSRNECFDILLKKNATIPNKLANGELFFPSCMLQAINHKENDIGIKMASLAVNIIDYKQLVCEEYLLNVHYVVMQGYLEYLKIIVNKYPNIVNVFFRDCTLLIAAIKERQYDIMDYLLSLNNIDLMIKFTDNQTYLHLLCGMLEVDFIKKILMKEPKLKDTGGIRSYIEWVIITEEAPKHPEKVIDIIKFFIESGIDVNKINDFGWRPLECAIQFSSRKVVETLIDFGAKINYDKKFNKWIPAILNNDPIGFASQIGKLDVVKLLIEKKATSHVCTINNHEIPTSLLNGISYGHSEIVTYLLSLDMMKTYINESTKKILFDNAIKEGICDKILLQELSSDTDIKSIEKISFDTNYRANGIINFVNRNINYETKWNLDPFYILHDLTTFYKNIFTFNGNQKQILNVLDSIITMYESITTCSCVSQMDNLVSIISSKMHNADINKLKKTIQIVIEMQTEDGIRVTEYCSFYKEIKKLRKEYSTKEIQSLFDLDSLLQHVIKHDKGLHKNIMNEYKNDDAYDIKTNSNKLLFKLLWPYKLNNYDYLYNQIFNNRDILSEISNMVVVRTKDRIIFRVNDLSSGTKPSRWINSYAPNIGKDDKRDPNHTFSFALDNVLHKYKCIEKKMFDSVHVGKKNTMLYFSGEIDIAGTVTYGQFEYFLNGYGTLFHRMFRPHNNHKSKQL